MAPTISNGSILPGCISGDTITAVAMTEPNAGSDLASMRTAAVDDGDYVVINGQKTFISNGIICDLLDRPQGSRLSRMLTRQWISMSWRQGRRDSRKVGN